ncbi:ClpP/crotonase [Tilletiopsis washingtonensis]|uniref:ClpP/crotonase n=1 Tax=Tilletiopsis washingtonensis TaxID=58919 RepID=A0A316Z163_9BASI|nr:ClpP/crotonase [Tilletiopsis washingtonensis]PWN95299.1 ClpP/crotonase [Tilletiopsis washingtonensis]
MSGPRTPAQPLVPPSVGAHLIVDLSRPHVLHLILNRPKQLNAMTDALEADLCAVLEWYEGHAELWLLLLSGAGRAFCAGQDLKAWAAQPARPTQTSPQGHALQHLDDTLDVARRVRRGGFGALSTRRSSKPVIAAVDALAMGGGVEILLNCDLVIASSRSIFALPEVKRGVIAAQGGIPRLASIAGHHRTAEMLLLGNNISASEAHDTFGFVNRIVSVDASASAEEGNAAVLDVAFALAAQINANSPDAVACTKEALLAARDVGLGADGVNHSVIEQYCNERNRALYVGENIKEGLKAFAEKRPTQWKNPPVFRRESKL